MKKCSHSAHESLSELNITPLLDLAFVLLVIFIITTIPPVKDDDLKLPVASKHEKDPPRKANYISLQSNGTMYLNRAPITMNELLPELLSMRMTDPDLNVIVRGDAKTKYKDIRAVLDLCQQANIAKLDLATEVDKK
ncbi:MAG: biopolymer transporter ExbD [Verrucomicrobiota bacterium]|jgi:biopolymer transport protein ExbD